MNWPDSVRATVKRLNFVQRSLQDRFISRDRAIQLFVLATICQENVLLVGPPGTAKTAIANRYTELIEARGFYYLLTRFTEPSELFGPLDLQEFEQGSYTIRTEGMLPEAQIVFLDEVFQGSSAILNTLLAILNEHIFYNGSVRQRVPLISLIGATNNLPEDPSLRAFADRFILRLEINPVANNELKDLIELGWDQEQERIEQTAQLIAGETTNEIIPAVKLTDVLELHGRLTEVNLSAVQPIYPELLRELRAEGIELSDRRIVKGLKLVAGAALMRGADIADIPDLWPLMHLWDRVEQAEAIKQIVQPRLAEAGVNISPEIRPVQEILEDLDRLKEREPARTSASAMSAYLSDLNELRQELIAHHPSDRDGLAQVEAVISAVMTRLEGNLSNV